MTTSPLRRTLATVGVVLASLGAAGSVSGGPLIGALGPSIGTVLHAAGILPPVEHPATGGILPPVELPTTAALPPTAR